MWYLLSDKCHSRCALEFLREKTLAKVLDIVSARDYANDVYGHFSHFAFVITTAPSYEISASPLHRKILVISPSENKNYDFRIHYGCSPLLKWDSEFRNGEKNRCCEQIECVEREAVQLIDNIVRRDLKARELKKWLVIKPIPNDK